MSEFKIDDIVGITEYIKSLDIYKQFDEIIVNQITQYTVMGRRPIEIEVKIVACDKTFYTHTERRLFTEPNVSFDHFFEQEVKDLSASIMFGRKLVEETEELNEFTLFSEGQSSGLVVSKTIDSQYNLYVNRDADDIVKASVLARYEFGCDDFTARHEFKTNRAIEIDELKSSIEHFKSLRDKIAADEISS